MSCACVVLVVCRAEVQYKRELKLATDRKEMMEHFLVLELETVGNIRLEEGTASDTWYTHRIFNLKQSRHNASICFKIRKCLMQ